jgi:hypothetical protein
MAHALKPETRRLSSYMGQIVQGPITYLGAREVAEALVGVDIQPKRGPHASLGVAAAPLKSIYFGNQFFTFSITNLFLSLAITLGSGSRFRCRFRFKGWVTEPGGAFKRCGSTAGWIRTCRLRAPPRRPPWSRSRAGASQR